MSADENQPNAIEALEQQFASEDARVADSDPGNPDNEDSAASEDDAGTENTEESTEDVDESEDSGADSEDEGGSEDDGSDADASDAKPKPKKKPTGAQARIGELTREKYEARREADQLRAQLQDALQRSQKTDDPQPQTQGNDQGAPTLEQFDYDPDQYMAARIQWEVDQKLSQAEKNRQESEAKKAIIAKRDAFNEKAQAFATDHGDFYDVVYGNQTLPINETMSQYIMDSEHGPEVAYHLGQHPDEAHAIAAMTPYMSGAALARLEDRLAAPATPDTPAQPAQVTRAPPVAKRVSAATQSDAAASDMQAHIAAVRKQHAA